MNPIQYVEIPADDVKRCVDFYTKLFGWEANEYRGERAACGSYFHMQTSKDESSAEVGIMQRQAKEHSPTAYITVSSVDDYAKKIEEAGGKLCFPKMAVPKMGWFACFLDSEKNVLAIWEEDKNAEPSEEQKKEMEKWDKKSKECDCKDESCECK